MLQKKILRQLLGWNGQRAHKALKIVELPEIVWGFIHHKKLSDGHAEAYNKIDRED